MNLPTFSVVPRLSRQPAGLVVVDPVGHALGSLLCPVVIRPLGNASASPLVGPLVKIIGAPLHARHVPVVFPLALNALELLNIPLARTLSPRIVGRPAGRA